METTTLAEAFAFFDSAPVNPRWSWSAVSPDSRKVTITIWEHEMSADGSVDYFGDPRLRDWTSKPGNHERIRNLQIARDSCDSLFHVIWVTARDLEETPRKIAGRYPEKHLMMKLIDLDEMTGEFSAGLVDPATPGHERRAMSDRAFLPPTPSTRERTGRRAGNETTQRAIAACPNCFMELPVTGSCGSCE